MMPAWGCNRNTNATPQQQVDKKNNTTNTTRCCQSQQEATQHQRTQRAITLPSE